MIWPRPKPPVPPGIGIPMFITAGARLLGVQIRPSR